MKSARWIALFTLAVAVINYPNPFNPKGGEIATFEGTSNTSTESMLYLYDMSARLLFSQNFPLPGGAVSRISWSGYGNDNQLAGNGVYLYRVVELPGKNTIAKGKVWVINK